jgi:UPF0755 protein
MDNQTGADSAIRELKPRCHRWLIFSVAAIATIAILAAGFLVYAYYQVYQPINKNNLAPVEFAVEKGTGVKEIAAGLQKAGIIRSAFWFKIYVLCKKLGSSLQAGDYAIGQNLNIPQLVDMLTGGKIIPNEAQITFPEGFTVKQIKARLVEAGVVVADSLDDEKIDAFQIQYKFLSSISPQAGLEGFLFPDTYRFRKDIKKEEIVKRFLDNFDHKLTPAWREEISRQGKTIYQIITLASIVQQESLNEQEMPMIAGIFYNRLNKGMLLQSDATVNYATGKKERQPSVEDIKIQSPYNTYLYAGLPPTPICNSGIEAIKAAIYPQTSDYFYFLHPLNSQAVYSKTLEEHNRNKAKYLR